MRLVTTDEQGVEPFLRRAHDGTDETVLARAREIVLRVRRDGDRALRELARELDHVEVSALRVDDAVVRGAQERIPRELARALSTAERRVFAFARRQRRALRELSQTRGGVTLGQRVIPVSRAGVYVPGGRYPLPSTAIMGVACARAAGVRDVAVATPPGPTGHPDDAVLAACATAGAKDVYVAGGAQAIAALAFGTETVRPVDVVVGPGNVYVQAAKRLVHGSVGIDLPAGPSEVLVLAEPGADPELAAWDLVAQCEHDPLARAFFVTWSRSLAVSVCGRAHALVQEIETRDEAAPALDASLAVVCRDESEACRVADAIAPEHLAVHADEPRRFRKKLRRYGALFLGPLSAVPLGDFILGPNHTLPTGGSARFASGLSPLHFLTVRPFAQVSPRGFARLERAARSIARAEGLVAHERAIAARRKRRVTPQ